MLADCAPGQPVFGPPDPLPGAREIGRSEEGRPIHGYVLGSGPSALSLIAGAHSDEPVGPRTLRALVQGCPPDLLERHTFVVVPHINPDGEVRNRAWTDRWPDPAAYMRHVFREPPGRDLEFGFPSMRPENVAVSRFLEEHAPFKLHMSLHGMGAAEGAMLLIERHWTDRVDALREGFVAAVRGAGLPLHDHDRKGEKGFTYLGPGFTTTPEGGAMRRHFEQLGDPGTAALFHQSSMEFVRSLGGDPLCLVTELPLFVVPNPDPVPGTPTAYLALRERLASGEPVDPAGLRAVDLGVAMRLQLATIELGLAAQRAE
jgi:hypothetical protein